MIYLYQQRQATTDDFFFFFGEDSWKILEYNFWIFFSLVPIDLGLYDLVKEHLQKHGSVYVKGKGTLLLVILIFG